MCVFQDLVCQTETNSVTVDYTAYLCEHELHKSTSDWGQNNSESNDF